MRTFIVKTNCGTIQVSAETFVNAARKAETFFKNSSRFEIISLAELL